MCRIKVGSFRLDDQPQLIPLNGERSYIRLEGGYSFFPVYRIPVDPREPRVRFNILKPSSSGTIPKSLAWIALDKLK